MLLRKVVSGSTSLTDNAQSFTNVTARRLHIRKVFGVIITRTASALGDVALTSLDEVPTGQSKVNDSRAHIGHSVGAVTGATGAIAFQGQPFFAEFARGDLYLDPDESLFVNNEDIIGAPPVNATWNIWYED